jgi:hypothetical protein
MMMKNKKRFYFTTVLIILSSCILTGCQLANETIAVNNPDQLCGVFVTLGNEIYPSMDDTEVTVNGKGEVTISNQPSANIVEGTMEDGRVKFGDVTGYYMGYVDIDFNNSMNNCSGADQGFHDVKYAVFSKDGKEEIEAEATLSVSRNSREVIHINPAYIRSDGSIYTILGQDIGYMNTGESSGSIYSQTLTDEKKSTIGDIITSEKESYKVNIALVDEAKQVVIKEMNTNDALIKTTLYSQTDADEFVTDPNTSYVIVEELMSSYNTKEYTKRSIYSLKVNDPEAEYNYHTCNFPGEGGVIGTKSVRFKLKK